jgi:hypothetical protein
VAQEKQEFMCFFCGRSTLNSKTKGGFRARISEFKRGDGEQKMVSNAEINPSAMAFSWMFEVCCLACTILQ